jgi:hypothetical protein
VLSAFLLLAAISLAVYGDELSSADANAQLEASSDTDLEKHPNLKVRLLMVYRDWSLHDGERLRKELEALIASDQLSAEQPSIDNILSVTSFLPKAGEAAVFENSEFESLLGWLRAHELVANEQSVQLEQTRFERRWTASIEPKVDKQITLNEIWHMQLDLIPSNDPGIVGRLKIKRTHARKPPAEGPRLRGAALNIRKEVSFFLPRERAVVMSWYAHPEDSQPNTEQRATEPILVFELASDDEHEQSAAEFKRPEKVIELMVE